VVLNHASDRHLFYSVPQIRPQGLTEIIKSRGIARIWPDVGHETSRIQIASLNSTLMVV
jgi:hypothetical protein